jgi:arsenate reductase-like glutaredoxin family protein
MATKQPKPKAPPPPAMVEIETETQAYADARAKMAKAVQTLKDGLKRVTDRHVDDLRQLAADVGVHHQALLDLIAAHPELFEKPRSQAFHGVTVGYLKGKGRITYSDADKVIERIEKALPEQLDTLAPASRTLSHKALELLDGKQLKSIGVAIVNDGDKPYIKTPADDVEKFTAGIVAAYTTTATQEQSA